MLLNSRLRIIAVSGIIGFIFLLLWAVYFKFMLGPAASLRLTSDGTEFLPQEVTVVPAPLGANTVLIAKGQGLRDIAETLEQQHLIRSASAFKLYSILTGRAHKLKPGVYNVDPASTTPEIVRVIAAGPARDIAVLVTEGETVREIDAKLARFGIIEKGTLLHAEFQSFIETYPFLAKARSVEGFLFPDTYRFYFDSDARDILAIFLENFSKKAMPSIRLSGIDPLDAVIVASLIEKEVSEPNDRRLVSGIIYNRLEIDMPLQIDATLPYAKLNGALYDTYKYYGLPPGPIANPGIDAIEAALEPKRSAYLYYLSDPKTGTTIFSKTFEEHDNNRAKYLRNGSR